MSHVPGRPSARRLPSSTSAWGRLRAPPTDALLAYGLVSKGDIRLNDAKLQESFYKKIVERYVRFCASVGGGDSLEQVLASLSVADKTNKADKDKDTDKEKDKLNAGPARDSVQAGGTEMPSATMVKAATPAQKSELETILMAMRKLRESITAMHRTDTFSQRAYVFMIHASILTRHWQSYQPALMYLLYKIHPVTPLPEAELQEMAGFVILDLGCRQKEYSKAYSFRQSFEVKEQRVSSVLRALVLENWILFWRIKKRVDGLFRALMTWAEDDVRMHALKCLGKSYLVANKTFIERSADRSWIELVKNDGVGWELGEKSVVTIRRVAPKAS